MNHGEGKWHEQAIRDAVLAGDATAWRSLYATHFDSLAAYARWRCGGLADLADDVIQEAWLTVVRRLRSFDPAKGTLLDWLRGITANVARNAIRARRRHRQRSRPLEAVDEPSCVCPDPAATGKAEQTAAALAELPEHYEAVLRAKYLDGQCVNAIAAMRNESPKAVESLLTRARQAFREAFQKLTHD